MSLPLLRAAAMIPFAWTMGCGEAAVPANGLAAAPQARGYVGPSPTAPSPQPSAVAAPTVVSRYTTLRDCPVVRANPDEAGYSLTRCPGVGGYDLDVSESDGRQSLALVTRTATRQLNLPGVIGSGFSELGAQAEWRTRADADRPHALVVRYAVVEDPAVPAQPTAYLVVVDLDRACVIGRIAPGADQNAAARRIADADRVAPCLTVPSA